MCLFFFGSSSVIHSLCLKLHAETLLISRALHHSNRVRSSLLVALSQSFLFLKSTASTHDSLLLKLS
jgi:hypothetical protein